VGAARRKYTEEYKTEAVELVITSGRPIAEIAPDLGIHDGTLGNRVSKAPKNGTAAEKPPDAAERAELKALREENRRLKRERDLLKKAATWFASQNQ
jgi:transposase